MTTQTDRSTDGPREPSMRGALLALALSAAFVAATRPPVARPGPFEPDEVGYLAVVRESTFPMHHTLFLAAGREVGRLLGDPYAGFVALDAAVSALAIFASWWWLRALVGPRAAAGGALVLGCAPVFWAYGAMAGNYAAIVLVGSTLLGVAYRGATGPRPWHPHLAAVVFGIGVGYRQDLGTLWLPVFVAILWRHRWVAAAQAGLLFAAVNLAWLAPMLRDAGGWHAYREASAEFAYKAGYLNSVWNLGWVDAPARYAVKGLGALAWTFGPGLFVAPIGMARLGARPHRWWLALLLGLSVGPALASHLLVHFGVAGYAMHYAPALLALISIGLDGPAATGRAGDALGARRSVALAAILAGVFLFYPTDYDRPGLRGTFDLAFARQTRVGLRTRTPLRDPESWRTANSQTLPGGVTRPEGRRSSITQVFGN